MLDYIISNTPLMWLAVIVIAAVLEAVTTQVITIWFAVGAFGALLAGAFSAPLYVQIIIFTFVSVLLLILARPILMRFMKNTAKISTVNSEIGRTAKVVQEINALKKTGRVLLGDVNWNAVSENGSDVIEIGENVEVRAVDGTTLVVSKITEKEKNNV